MREEKKHLQLRLQKQRTCNNLNGGLVINEGFKLKGSFSLFFLIKKISLESWRVAVSSIKWDPKNDKVLLASENHPSGSQCSCYGQNPQANLCNTETFLIF